MKKGVLKNFSKFTGKHLCQSFFFNKVPGGRHRCFPVNFAKFLRTPFYRTPLDDCFETYMKSRFFRVIHTQALGMAVL